MKMDKLKLSKEEFDLMYEIEQESPKELATDTSPEEEVKEEHKEESILTEEEQAHDKQLEETLNWNEEE